MYKVFQDAKVDACLIDPFTGLDRNFTHADNYRFLNETRNFVNETGLTVYVNTHPNSEAARSVYPDNFADKDLRGYQKPPSRSQSEGGQPFANRCDEFITVHRYIGHPLLQYKTLIFIRKVKDTETGGIPTSIKDPVIFDWNSGLGFTCNNHNPISNALKPDGQLQDIKPNERF